MNTIDTCYPPGEMSICQQLD